MLVKQFSLRMLLVTATLLAGVFAAAASESFPSVVAVVLLSAVSGGAWAERNRKDPALFGAVGGAVATLLFWWSFFIPPFIWGLLWAPDPEIYFEDGVGFDVVALFLGSALYPFLGAIIGAVVGVIVWLTINTYRFRSQLWAEVRRRLRIGRDLQAFEGEFNKNPRDAKIET